jgi:hypothetical protein
MIALFLTMLALASAGGCAPAIAHYEWTTDEAALAELARRSALVRTVEASCSISMHDEGGRDVTLDGALVARNPDEFRLRAWKLQHAAFDITAGPDGIWIDAPSPNREHDIDPAALGKGIKEAWSMFAGGFLQGPLVIDRERTPTGALMLMEAKSADDLITRCVVDCRTLAPLRYEAIGPDGAPRYVIRLERHRQFGEIVFPQRITFEDGSRRIAIDLDDVEFNGEPNPLAFKPPSRAVRLP